MKIGKNLQELATEIKEQAKTKRDFVARADKIGVISETAETAGGTVSSILLDLADKGRFPVLDICHGQIAEHTGIPKPYYDRMRRESPHLLRDNIAEWFARYPAPRLVRTLNGNARAFLSDKFSTDFDHYDFGKAIFPILDDRNLRPVSCEITERKLYVKAIDEQLFRDVPVGFKMGDGSHRIFDTVAPVIAFGNSEVGFGRWFCDIGVYTKACTNLAMFAKGGMKRHHIGARHKLADDMDIEDLESILSASTKRKVMEATLAQLRDVVMSAFDEGVIRKRCEKLAETAGHKIEAKVEDVIERTKTTFNLTDDEGELIFKRLIEGANLTQYGLHAAVTRASADVASYDRATELEYLGGRIVELAADEWKALAAA